MDQIARGLWRCAPRPLNIQGGPYPTEKTKADVLGHTCMKGQGLISLARMLQSEEKEEKIR